MASYNTAVPDANNMAPKDAEEHPNKESNSITSLNYKKPFLLDMEPALVDSEGNAMPDESMPGERQLDSLFSVTDYQLYSESIVGDDDFFDDRDVVEFLSRDEDVSTSGGPAKRRRCGKSLADPTSHSATVNTPSQPAPHRLSTLYPEQ